MANKKKNTTVGAGKKSENDSFPKPPVNKTGSDGHKPDDKASVQIELRPGIIIR